MTEHAVLLSGVAHFHGDLCLCKLGYKLLLDKVFAGPAAASHAYLNS